MHIDLGGFHPVLVHFPIVLFSLMLICDLLNGIGRKGAWPVANWMLFGGTIMCIPTLITGWEASKTFPLHDPTVARHMWLAFLTFTIALVHSGFRVMALVNNWNLLPLVYVICSVLTLSCVYWTSDYGGMLTHNTTLFPQF